MTIGDDSSQADGLHRQFLAGRMDLWLEGKLLRGGYRLECHGSDWRLRKLEDGFVSSDGPQWTGRSIFSGRTLEDL